MNEKDNELKDLSLYKYAEIGFYLSLIGFVYLILITIERWFFLNKNLDCAHCDSEFSLINLQFLFVLMPVINVISIFLCSYSIRQKPRVFASWGLTISLLTSIFWIKTLIMLFSN